MNNIGLSDFEIDRILKEDDSINNISNDVNFMESPNENNVKVVLNTNTDTKTNTNTETIAITDLITKTNTNTITNTVSEGISESISENKKKNEGRLIDIRKDIDFEKNDYSPKKGFSFVKIYDTSTFKQVKRSVENNSMDCYITRADIVSSPQGFEEENTYLILTNTAMKPFYDTIVRKEHKKDVYCIIYRASKFKYGFKEVSKERFDELLLLNDCELFRSFNKFNKLGRERVGNLKRNPEQLKNLILKLIDGKEDKSIMKSLFFEIIKEGFKFKFTDEELKKTYQTQYGAYFDSSEFENMLQEVKGG